MCVCVCVCVCVCCVCIYVCIYARISLSLYLPPVSHRRVMVCEEWWDSHIEWLGKDIPRLLSENRLLPRETTPQNALYSPSRKAASGCVAAVVDAKVKFPPAATLKRGDTFSDGEGHLYVNMLPFDPEKPATLPLACQQYMPLIQKCLKLSKGERNYPGGKQRSKLAFLTIDERPVKAGTSQR